MSDIIGSMGVSCRVVGRCAVHPTIWSALQVKGDFRHHVQGVAGEEARVETTGLT